jgi:hypothetical protein
MTQPVRFVPSQLVRQANLPAVGAIDAGVVEQKLKGAASLPEQERSVLADLQSLFAASKGASLRVLSDADRSALFASFVAPRRAVF